MKTAPAAFSACVLALFLCCLPGCGSNSDRPELGYVSGTVTMDGRPASGLQVVFEPETGRPAAAVTDDSGKYTLEYTADASGTKTGPNVVRITTYREQAIDAETDDVEEVEEPIPPRYHREAPDNPEMNVEITSGSNEFNFDLKSE